MNARFVFIVCLLFGGLLPAATLNWDGGAGTSLWSDSLNWSTDTIPAAADTAAFSGSAPLSISLNGNRSITAVSFSGSSAYTLSNNTLTLSGASPLTTNSPSSGSITHEISSAVALTNSAVTLSVATNLTLSGGLTAAGTVTKSGSGTLTLSGSNTFTGGTTISAGTLEISGSLGSGSYSGNIANSGSLFYSGSGSQTFSGVISGSGALQTTNGNLTLTGNNTYTGTTTVASASGLIVGNGGTSGSLGSGNLSCDGVTFFKRSDNVTYAGLISGSGYLIQSGAGTLTLTGASNYSGTVDAAAGTILINGGNTSAFSSLYAGIYNLGGSGAVTISGSGTQVNVGSDVQLGNDASGTMTVTNNALLNITGPTLSVGVFHAGTSSLTISNGGKVFGPTPGGVSSIILDNGTLEITDSNTSSNPFTVNSGGGAIDTGSNSVTLSGAISGSGSMTKSGSGTLTLSGSNTFTGATTVSAGTLEISGSLGSGSYSGNIANSGSLFYSGSGFQTFSGVISGSGALQTDNGNLTLTGNNTYTGTTTVASASALFVGNGGTSGSLGSGNLSSDGVTFFKRSDNVTYAGLISGSGYLIQSGAGTLTLTGASNYSGTVDAAAGTILINGGNTSAFSSLYAGIYNLGGSGAVTISGSGTQVNVGSDVQLGNDASGTMTVTNNALLNITGPTLSVGVFHAGTSSLTISNGGKVLGPTPGGVSSIILDNGTLEITDSNTSPNPFTVNSGGGTIDTGANAVTLSGAISGSGPLTKSGSGVLTLTAANPHSGTTSVAAGTLSLTGSGSLASSTIQVASGATFNHSATVPYTGSLVVASGGKLAGSGTVGAISGAGTISPGNSPGILTATSANLGSAGESFQFEFTTATPNYNDAFSSGSDLLHLTGGTPLIGSATSANRFDIYFAVSTLSYGLSFHGGLFTDQSTDFASLLGGGSFNYYVKGDGGGSHSFNGTSYYTLSEFDSALYFQRGTTTVSSANFASGTVLNGSVLNLTVVPEPSACGLLVLGLLAFAVRRRR